MKISSIFKTAGISIFFLALITILPASVFAQNPSGILDQASNQDSLLPRIYVNQVDVKTTGQNKVTGSFTIRNSETAAVGDIQYEIMLLDPLPETPVGQLVADSPNVYDRQRVSDVINLAAGETRIIPISYQAPAVPEGAYRVRIQIVTTNDRKLGWEDASITLGGANGFFVITPISVNVDSIDPLTKEQDTSWPPLDGVNVNANTAISLTADIYNPGKAQIIGTPRISVKRLLYEGINPIITDGKDITLDPGVKQTITIPITTQPTPSAYIILFTVVDKNGKNISGVGEYRYVVRGQSASVASAQIKSIPNHRGELAQIDFVIAGSADRVTPVDGTMEFTVTDSQGVAGTIQKTFSIKGTTPVKGSAYVTLTRNLCGTPNVTIALKNTATKVLDNYKVTLPNFTPLTCFSFAISDHLTAINLILATIAVVLIYGIYRLKKHQPSKK